MLTASEDDGGPRTVWQRRNENSETINCSHGRTHRGRLNVLTFIRFPPCVFLCVRSDSASSSAPFVAPHSLHRRPFSCTSVFLAAFASPRATVRPTAIDGPWRRGATSSSSSVASPSSGSLRCHPLALVAWSSLRGR